MSDVTMSIFYKSKISKLKIDQSPGLDQLHPRVLYETRGVISYPFFLIF